MSNDEFDTLSRLYIPTISINHILKGFTKLRRQIFVLIMTKYYVTVCNCIVRKKKENTKNREGTR